MLSSGSEKLVNYLVNSSMRNSRRKLHEGFVERILNGDKPSWKNIWEHNSSMVDTDTAAWLYVINLCHQNANDSVGTLIYLEGDDTEVVSSQPRNEAWYQVANSTLASVLDDWREYMTYDDRGTVEEWEEMVRLYTRYAL